MRTEDIVLFPASPGTQQSLRVHRFGTSGARPKIYIQAGLHADEMPGVLTATHLCKALAALDAAGKIRGEIVLVPLANPIGLSQFLLGSAIGRFNLGDGENFNRGYPELGEAVASRVDGQLGPDADENTKRIRAALQAEVEALPHSTAVQSLKATLLRLSIDSDAVLDLHCDSESIMHLYGLTPQADRSEALWRYLEAEVVLLATESGDNPFDEATSRPWLELQRRFPTHPISLACIAVTVELRGRSDVNDEMAERDAQAILDYLAHEKAIDVPLRALPSACCKPTPLAGCEPLIAPVGGVIVYHRNVGDRIEAGDLVADIVDPVTLVRYPVHAVSTGILFSRRAVRYAQAGGRVGKLAGEALQRTGKLLSP